MVTICIAAKPIIREFMILVLMVIMIILMITMASIIIRRGTAPWGHFH